MNEFKLGKFKNIPLKNFPLYVLDCFALVRNSITNLWTSMIIDINNNFKNDNIEELIKILYPK